MADKPNDSAVYGCLYPPEDGTEEEIIQEYFRVVNYLKIEIPDWIKEKYPFEYAKLTLLNERYNYLLEEGDYYDH